MGPRHRAGAVPSRSRGSAVLPLVQDEHEHQDGDLVMPEAAASDVGPTIAVSSVTVRLGALYKWALTDQYIQYFIQLIYEYILGLNTELIFVYF